MTTKLTRQAGHTESFYTVEDEEPISRDGFVYHVSSVFIVYTMVGTPSRSVWEYESISCYVTVYSDRGDFVRTGDILFHDIRSFPGWLRYLVAAAHPRASSHIG
jgi:hypothetical protein